MPWTKETAPKSAQIKRAPYSKRRGLYINVEVRKRDGKETSRHHFVRVPVPKSLRKRYTRNTVVRYLGTADATEALKLAPAAVAAIRAEFAAMERQNALTAEAARHIQSFETWRAHSAMLADPVSLIRPTQDIDFDKIEDDARATLAKLGLDPSPRNIGAAMDALYAGKIGAEVLWDRGITPQPAPLHSLPAARLAAAGDGKTVVAAADLYASDATEEVKEKTRGQLKQSARLFQSFVGEGVTAGAVTRDHAADFRRRLLAIDPDYRRAVRPSVSFTFAELEEKFPAAQGEGMSRATVNRHVTNLRSLFTWLSKGNGLPRDHDNPFTGMGVKRAKDADDTQYEAMSDGDIAKLLDGLPLAHEPAKGFTDSLGWIIAVAAYTGLRQGEVLALKSDDFQSKDGVRFIVVRKGKTVNARRSVPIHDALIEAGLSQYAKKCDGLLFTAAKNFASRFTDYRVERGVGIDEGDRIVFHSLRKSFNTKLAHAKEPEIPVGIRASLLGHAGGEIHFTDKHYLPDGHDPKRLKEVVNRIEYNGVKLS
jgi:integrase